MAKITIFDTTLRDGEQSPGATMSTAEKLRMAAQLDELGVDVIEAGFPVASDDDFGGVRAIVKEVRRPVIAALARAHPLDVDRAGAAVEAADKPRIHVFLATSDIHLKHKLEIGRAECVERVVEGVERAIKIVDDVEFSPEDATRTDPEFLCQVVQAAVRAGATTINIPDTVGYAIPGEIANRITILRNTVPNIDQATLSIHCHNDLGLAVANSLAAMEAGCDQIECTINGLGERAGNASLEELVMAIRLRGDDYQAETNINTREIWPTSRLVSQLTGMEVQRNKAIVGDNAFAHEAGIHQHGVIADRNTYEILNAEEVGWKGRQLVIGKHSGMHAVDEILKGRGYTLDSDQVREVTRRVKERADQEKTVEEEDVIAFAGEVLDELSPEELLVELSEVSVMTGNRFTASATLKMCVAGREIIGTGTGVGPVDAAAAAMQAVLHSAFGPDLELKEYGLKAITGGTNALAHAHIAFSDDQERQFRGEAVDADVILASVQAMVKGANRALTAQRHQQEESKREKAVIAETPTAVKRD